MLRYKVTYKMEMTIDPKFTHGIPQREEKIIEIPLGETVHMSGTKEDIKRKLCANIDKVAKYIDDWYYGEDEGKIDGK